ARAYCGIADCCCYLYANAGKASQDLKQADEASRKALELAPDLAEAHASRAVSLSLASHPEEAEKAFDTAIRLDPLLFEARYFYARHCFAQGKLEKAARLYAQASRVRPEDYQAPLLMGQVFSDLGRIQEAEEARRRGVKIAEEHLKTQPDDIRALYMGANGLVALGDIETGLLWTGRALSLESTDPMVLYNLACIYALAGELDLSIDCLEPSVERGFSYREWLERDSNLDPIRTHPRFANVITALNAQARKPLS
ncbi:MAG TPA: tetratricopeptide repeat protein, partial [Acidobacteriota bacterium]|nr:tetratricopeptide repeat protein [Acidobacteriota bacterium]